MKVKLDIEYDGAQFLGWQIQSQTPTVQGALEAAFKVYLESLAKELKVTTPALPQLVASGRTDTGVSARSQIVSFVWPENLTFKADALRRALNGLCPDGLVVKDVARTADDFDARRSPHVKCYSYTFALRRQSGGVLGDRAWAIGNDLDVHGMIRAARCFAGTHDFSSFRASDCMAETTTRTIVFSELCRIDKDLLVYYVGGKGFLKQMVRNLAGTLAAVGWKKMKWEYMPDLIAVRDRTKAGQTAPPHGLMLEWIKYS